MTSKTAQKTRSDVRFYHPDHLGSTTVVTDLDGEVTQNVAYIPYGEVFVEQRNGTWNTPYLFNAKELDEETGLYYYGARYLDPTNVTWMSVDPIWEKNIDANPYNYCHGNPITITDPNGMDDYELDDEGHIYFLKKTDSDKDVIYHYTRKRNGEIREKYTKSFTLDKGHLKRKDNLSDKREEVNNVDFDLGNIKYKGTELEFSNSEKDIAKNFFEFVADKSDVEWSYAEYEDNILVSTSHEMFQETFGTAKAQVYASKLKHHIHSHPDIPLDYGSPRNISQSDINFKNSLIRRGYTGKTQAYAVKYREYIDYDHMSKPLLNQR